MSTFVNKHLLDEVHLEVVGVYRRPTLFCERNGCGRRPTGFTWGKKWGWQICTTCARPAKMYWQNVFGSLTFPSPFGFNLLDRLFP